MKKNKPNKIDKPKDEVAELTVGARLAVARERLRLTQEKVASDLHWEVKLIAHIEAEEFDQLPPKPYVRGYIRSYASYLGLPPDALVTLFHDAVGDSEYSAQPLSAAITGERPPLRGYSYFGIVLLLVVALGGLYSVKEQWFHILSDQPITTSFPSPQSGLTELDVVPQAAPAFDSTVAEMDSATSLAPAPALPTVDSPSAEILEPVAKEEELPLPQAQHLMEEPTVTPSSVESDAGVETQSTATGDGLATDVATSESAAVAEKSVGGDNQVLEITLEGDSWMDLRDPQGNKLLFGIKKAGSKHLVSAKLPVTGTVGNYAQVKIEYNGKLLILDPFGTTGVAKLNFTPSEGSEPTAPADSATAAEQESFE